MEAKILFTSPCGPYPKLPIDEDPIDYFYYRNTLKQKVFQLRSFQSWHSLHFLAQNIPINSVVLENPSKKYFRKEVNKGEYQIVAIGFTILLTKKVLEMAIWLKQNHPNIEIVLGGYGTAIFKESFETSDKLKEIADYICFGEGLSFMNSMIKEKWNIENKNELKQNLLPARNSFYRTNIELFRQIVLIGGLGCVNACSFCATSSQYNRNYISLFSGKQLFDSLCEQKKKYPKIQSAIIYEEDFLLNKTKVLEFISYFQKSELSHQPILLTIFASVRSILKYSVDELIACGIGTIFIGVESLSDEVLLKENLSKRKGKVKALFEKLHSNGINTLGSLIVGWDSQTEEMAEVDSKEFIDLNPTFYQVVPLHCVPGTKLWENMKLENRISSNYKVELDGISDFNFQLKNYSHIKARKLILKTYSGLVNEGGAWPFRLFENLLKGYVKLKDNKNPTLTKRAKIYKSMIFPVCLIAFTSRLFFWGNGFRKRWANSMIKFYKAFPLWFFLSLLLSPLVAIYLLIIYLLANLFFILKPLGDQPDFIKKTYDKSF